MCFDPPTTTSVQAQFLLEDMEAKMDQMEAIVREAYEAVKQG